MTQPGYNHLRGANPKRPWPTSDKTSLGHSLRKNPDLVHQLFCRKIRWLGKTAKPQDDDGNDNRIRQTHSCWTLRDGNEFRKISLALVHDVDGVRRCVLPSRSDFPNRLWLAELVLEGSGCFVLHLAGCNSQQRSGQPQESIAP